jgi:ferredoxin
VTESCIRCKYTDCIDVCPANAYREGLNFLAIDPDDCIDCAVRVPESPVEAIFAEEDVPADQLDFGGLNAELARKWQPITRANPALDDADHWAGTKDKRAQLARERAGAGLAPPPESARQPCFLRRPALLARVSRLS